MALASVGKASDAHFKCAYTLARSEFEFRIAPASALCALMQRESASVERVSVSESVRVRVRGEEVVEYEVSGCNEMTQISGCNPLQQAFDKGKALQPVRSLGTESDKCK